MNFYLPTPQQQLLGTMMYALVDFLTAISLIVIQRMKNKIEGDLWDLKICCVWNVKVEYIGKYR